MIAIIDYKIGNKGSIKNMFKHLSEESIITDNPEEIAKADKLLLPGVGHFKMGMEYLNQSGLIPVIEKEVFEKKKPILGICLGMQLMTKHSEEGDTEGLAWVDAKTVKFKPKSNDLKVPHMGWNYVNIIKENELIPQTIQEKQRFYFVHSYCVQASDKSIEIAKTDYDGSFVSYFQKDNIYGMQFHPEKSHRFGMEVFKNFASL